MMQKVDLVVGGGISGLYAAHRLRWRKNNRPVVLIEQSAFVGGLLRSYDYGHKGIFDHGIHTFYETGIAAIDDVLLGVLPENDWNFLTGYARDLAGSWLDGRLQYETPYPSLTGRTDKARLLEDFFANLGRAPANDEDSALEVSRARFGSAITDAIVRPALERRQHVDAEDVHSLALDIQGLSRIAALPQESVEALGQISGFNSRMAFPNQRAYPAKFLSSRRSYYPRKIGLSAFLDAFTDQLSNADVEILTEATVQTLTQDKGGITNLSLRTKDGGTRHFEVGDLFWAGAMPPLVRLLGIDSSHWPFDAPNKTVICNMLVNHKPNNDGVYYTFFHGHDRVHRVSHPDTYSGSTREDGLYPINVEMVYPNGSPFDDAGEVAVQALRGAGIIGGDTSIEFLKIEADRPGYPCMSIKNMKSIRNMREAINELSLSNLYLIGIFGRERTFYQTDVLRHVDEILG